MALARVTAGVTYERAVHLFEPDVLLPSQYARIYERGDLCPQARLAVAVIEDGIEALRKYGSKDEPRARMLTREALEWFRGARAPMGFEQACDAVGLDADVLGPAILRAYRSWDARRRVTKMKLPVTGFSQIGRRRVAGHALPLEAVG